LNKVNGKDGVQALQVEHYGSTGQSPTRRISQPKNGSASTEPGADDLKDEGTQTVIVQPDVAVEVSPISEPSHASSSESLTAQTPKRTYVRSGSITESVIETRGVRKVILATTGSNEDEEGLLVSRSPTAETSPTSRTASRSALSFFGTSAKDRLEEENEEETEEEEGLLKAETEVSGNEGSDANGVGGSMDGGASSSTSTTRPKETKAPARKKPNRRRKRKGGRS
jgi:metal transporter CNNM